MSYNYKFHGKLLCQKKSPVFSWLSLYKQTAFNLLLKANCFFINFVLCVKSLDNCQFLTDPNIFTLSKILLKTLERNIFHPSIENFTLFHSDITGNS